MPHTVPGILWPSTRLQRKDHVWLLDSNKTVLWGTEIGLKEWVGLLQSREQERHVRQSKVSKVKAMGNLMVNR